MDRGTAGQRDDSHPGGRSGAAEAGPRHVVITAGPGLWADPQRAATDVAASITLTGVPGAGDGRWLGAWLRADAAATGAAEAVLGQWGKRPAGDGAGPVSEPGPHPAVVATPHGSLAAGPAPGERPEGLPAARLPTGCPPTVIPPSGGLTAPGSLAAGGPAGSPPWGELSEPGAARELIAALPENALLWCGNSLSVRDVDVLPPPRAGVRVIASRGASGIDGTFSTAAGAAMAHAAEHPGAVGFALIGDLSLLHDAPGLAIGPAEPRPDLCVVVVNNDGGGIFEGLEPARFKDEGHGGGTDPGAPSVFERVFGTSHGASVERLAAAFGLPYTLAARPGDLAKAVAAALPGTGPRIVEARTGRAANAALRAAMRSAAVSAVAATVAGT
jgi:hypothetical protein